MARLWWRLSPTPPSCKAQTVLEHPLLVIGVFILLYGLFSSRLERSMITPPMVFQNDWAGLGLAYAVLAVAMMGVVAAAALVIRRMDVQRFLRVAET